LAYTIAFVDDEDGDGLWRIGVNKSVFNDSDEREQVLTIVHELGHILFLNKLQAVPMSEATGCATYFTGDSCAQKGSMLYSYVRQFWNAADIQTADAAGEEQDNGLYSKKPRSFVTEYASTNPSEDLAETFAYFVLDEKQPGKTIAEKKINALYSFSDLVKVRDIMRKGIRSNVMNQVHAAGGVGGVE
jgi:hypothetical protein